MGEIAVALVFTGTVPTKLKCDNTSLSHIQQSYAYVPYSVSCQLIGRKRSPIYRQLKCLIEGTVTLIQRVDNIEQCSDI